MHKLCLFDYDGTIRKGLSIYDWIKFLVKNQLIHEEICRNIQVKIQSYYSDNLSYNELVKFTYKTYCKSLTGVNEVNLIALGKEYAVKEREQFSEFFNDTIRYLEENNFKTIIVSGSPSEVLNSVFCERNSIQIFGLELEKKSGIYTGKIEKEYGTVESKEVFIKDNIIDNYDYIISFGDSMADTPLFEVSNLSFLMLPAYSVTINKNLNTNFLITTSTTAKSVIEKLELYANQ
ncbi:MAG: HAD-IB family phosphatase [Lewinellaceae bacterium]|nr:HAD-IB family phosphatase [Lewinellaceae bacterium]